ncbi:MAG TPA: hypothetical protein VN612_12725 [Acidobacteriaceae bacterium]|nr:hypothetical protein [Acidobacteriaceae bacterium]
MVGFFFVVLCGLVVRYYLRGRRSSEATWEQLLGRLAKIDREKIALIARDATALSGEEAFALQPEAIWQMLGGMEGLELLERNCQVLVELATYVQRWHPEALVVAEQLRLNAREVEWHIGRLKGAARTGNLETAFASYAQRAVATYYLMTRHVLELYEQVSFPELAELQQAI